MQIDERKVSIVIVLDINGKMVLGEGDVELKCKMDALIERGDLHVLLNLGGVPYIDAAGLGEILRSQTSIIRSGGKLKLLNLTKRIQDLLVITKLSRSFEAFDNEHEALASF